MAPFFVLASNTKGWQQGDEALKTQTLDSGVENVAYCAPEVFLDGCYSAKTDIYSAAFVIWELAFRVLKGTPPPFPTVFRSSLSELLFSLGDGQQQQLTTYIFFSQGEHEAPYQDLVKQGLNSFQILRKTCTTGIRPILPDKFPASLQELIQKCWHEDPQQRPSAKGNRCFCSALLLLPLLIAFIFHVLIRSSEEVGGAEKGISEESSSMAHFSK